MHQNLIDGFNISWNLLHRADATELNRSESPRAKALGDSLLHNISYIDERPFLGLNLISTRDVYEIIQSNSYLKAHAAEMMRNLSTQMEPLVITQNGEAKAIMQDIKNYEQTQEAMALLKILALGQRQINEGKVQPAAEVIDRLRSRSNQYA